MRRPKQNGTISLAPLPRKVLSVIDQDSRTRARRRRGEGGEEQHEDADWRKETEKEKEKRKEKKRTSARAADCAGKSDSAVLRRKRTTRKGMRGSVEKRGKREEMR
jgi:hypothetical protein